MGEVGLETGETKINKLPERMQWLVRTAAKTDGSNADSAVYNAGVEQWMSILAELRESEEREEGTPDQIDNIIATLLAAGFQDGTTGLLNLNGYRENYERAISHAERYNEPLTLGVVDLDNFKKLNDQLGHDIGDKALEAVGEALGGRQLYPEEEASENKSLIRKADIACRPGGDEFIIIFPTTKIEAARIVIERIKAELPNRISNHLKRQGILDAPEVTASIGLSQWEKGKSAEALSREADADMYREKELRKTPA